MIQAIKKFFKQLRCKHDWDGRGFSYARCLKCDKQKYAPEIASAKINKLCSEMTRSGRWTQEEADKLKRKYLL